METPKSLLTNLPHTPGVYVYKNSQGKVIYVGKAADLAKRVKQYFQGNDAVGEKTRLLVSQISSLETITTASEFDALLLEAKLIHDWRPHYNVIAKDDRSPIYIVLTTNEELPRVLLLRKTALPRSTKATPAIFGPFQSATLTRALLRTLRQTIPFCTQKQRNGRPCFYTHLNLCRPCASVIAKMETGSGEREKLVRQYRLNITRLKTLLSGKGNKVRHELEREMRELASENKFEDAGLLKQQIQSLAGLNRARFDPNLYLSQATLVDDVREEELRELKNFLLPAYPNLSQLKRIEGYDISSLSGKQSTGSLVVLTNGRVDTGQYRKFKVKRKEVPHDVAMMAEVVSRRLKHLEWSLPNLIVVDGGKAQVGAVLSSLAVARLSIPVIGLSKRFEEIVIPKASGFKTRHLPLTSPAIHVLQRIRDEAHRFAKSYHTWLRAKSFLEV